MLYILYSLNVDTYTLIIINIYYDLFIYHYMIIIEWTFATKILSFIKNYEPVQYYQEEKSEQADKKIYTFYGPNTVSNAQ